MRENVAPVKNHVDNLTLTESYLNFPNLRALAIGMANNIPHNTLIPALFTNNFIYGTLYDQVNNNSFDVLKNLTWFQELFITTSGIRILDTSAFSGLNLTYLDLSFNYIGEIAKNDIGPSLVHQRSTVNERKSQETPFDRFEEEYAYEVVFQTVETTHDYQVGFNDVNHNGEHKVILRRNAISDLKSYPLQYFSFVTHLDLSFNKINYVHSIAFQNLIHLQELDLQFNPIRQIESLSMIPLTRLSNLRLNMMEFHGIMPLDFLLNVRTELNLQFGDHGYNIYRMLLYYGNRRVYFSEVISIDVSGIRVPVYYLSNNKPLFMPLLNLKMLKMNGAQLAYQPQSNFFYGIPKLQNLSMSNCWLETIPSYALTTLPHLSYLDLSYNKIEVLDKTYIPNLPNLKTLILAYNFIHTITPGTLQSLQTNGLANIDLRFNQIANIGPTIIDKAVLGNLSRLDLRGNPIHCECSLSETFGWFVFSSKEPGDVSQIPGFLPDCSYSVINYYGGCLVCGDLISDQLLSLFTYSVTQNCQEVFLLKVLASFILFILAFLLIPLLIKNEQMQEKIVNWFLHDVIQRHFNKMETEYAFTSQLLLVYDGFVYYDTSDSTVGDWVDKELIPRLESGNPAIQISVVGKDDWCGSTQVEQVLFKMKASRKTIVVLTNKFFLSPQCQYVLAVMEEWKYQFSKDSWIILSYGDDKCSPTLLQRGRRFSPYSVLHYSTKNDNVSFWKLLLHAVIV